MQKSKQKIAWEIAQLLKASQAEQIHIRRYHGALAQTMEKISLIAYDEDILKS